MTSAEKKAIYAALAKPFDEHCIQRTEGRLTGRGYDTASIGYIHVVARLNEVLGIGSWRAHRTVNVKEITRSNGRPAFEAICDITLELGEWVDGNFIVFAESLADGGHVASSEADARKGSYTNAFRKACSFFGIGKQAWEGSLDDDNLPGDHVLQAVQQPAQRPAPAAAPVGVSHAPVMQQSRTTPAPTRNRLTSKQLGAIGAIARKLGLDQPALRAATKQRFNAQPEFLTREQASQMISSLSQQAGNGHDNADGMHEPGMEG